MSELENNPRQDPNILSNPNSAGSSASDENFGLDSALSSAKDSHIEKSPIMESPGMEPPLMEPPLMEPPLMEPPLPDFTPTAPQEDETPQISIKTSGAAPTNLSSLFAPETPEDEEIGRQVARPVYRVSSANPDLPNNYPLPKLEDEEALPQEEGPSGWQTAWAITREVGETIILTLIIFFLIQLFVRNFRVVGTSMVGNLHDGQYLIIDKVTYNPFVRETIGLGGPDRGDVIVFKPPRNPEDDYVKRVIGLPGETVQVINGQVFVNDEPLDEPFQPTPGSYSMSKPVTVPEGQVFVLGDNRNNSNDSHNWGSLPMENIVGRAWVSYWPPDQWGTIPSDAPTEEATLWHLVGQVIPAANAQNE